MAGFLGLFLGIGIADFDLGAMGISRGTGVLAFSIASCKLMRKGFHKPSDDMSDESKIEYCGAELRKASSHFSAFMQGTR